MSRQEPLKRGVKKGHKFGPHSEGHRGKIQAGMKAYHERVRAALRAAAEEEGNG